MDSEGSSHSVNKGSCTSLGVELVKSPLHSDESLDGVSWDDLQDASSCDVELEDVLNSDVSVLSALLLLDWAVVLDLIVPLVHLNDAVFLVCNRVRSRAWVSNSEGNSLLGVVVLELEVLLLSWSSCVVEVPFALVDVDDGWESGLSLLTGVETIPNVVHLGVDLVPEGWLADLRDVDWLHGSVHPVLVSTLKDEDSEVVVLTIVTIEILVKSALILGWRESWIVWNDLEVCSVLSLVAFCD